ncbi:M48 family metallopeptidase [Anaerosporobacter sp.]
MNREYKKDKINKFNVEIKEDGIYYTDLKIPYELVRSKRKTLAIEIAVGGKVTVKIPLRATRAEVIRLLENKADWIYHAYQKQATRKRKGIEVREGVLLPFLDRTFRLHVEYSPSKKSADISVKEESILLIETPLLDSDFVLGCLESWYKKNARNIIAMRVNQYAKAMGVTYGRISIRSQKSRWGSCSSSGNLNFNWHLVMMPNKILDYVVIHELAHRIEMNHSKEFWDNVSKVCPEYKERKLWLKDNGLSYELYIKE